jgi:hypothetical protein
VAVTRKVAADITAEGACPDERDPLAHSLDPSLTSLAA